jgi:hypothetical protein
MQKDVSLVSGACRNRWIVVLLTQENLLGEEVKGTYDFGLIYCLRNFWGIQIKWVDWLDFGTNGHKT